MCKINSLFVVAVIILLFYSVGFSSVEIIDYQNIASQTTVKYPSMKIDSSNNIHIVYYDLQNEELNYATNSSGNWLSEVVDKKCLYPSIVLDSMGNVHISYFDSARANLKYATKNFESNWEKITIDSSEYVGKYSSIAVDSKDNIHISYYDSINVKLKYASNKSGNWTVESVGIGGMHTTIAIDGQDTVHISYQSTATATNGTIYHTVNYAKYSNNEWSHEIVTLSIGVSDISLAVDSQNYVHLIYCIEVSSNWGINSYLLFHSTNSSGKWEDEHIASNTQLSSMYIDSSDKIHVAYSECYKWVGAAGSMFCTKSVPVYANNITGSWQNETFSIADETLQIKSISIDNDSNNKPYCYYTLGDDSIVCSSSPYDGDWNGKTNQGHEINFKVQGECIYDFNIKTEVSSEQCALTATTNIPMSSSISVKDFIVSGNSGYYTGHFNNSTNSYGSWAYSSNKCGYGSGTWEASKKIKGDYNNNGKVDISDVMAVMKEISK